MLSVLKSLQSVRHWLRVHGVILSINIHERLLYRGDFAFGTLVRFLPIVTQIFLWGAVFGVGTAAARSTLHDYTYANMIAYFLLVNVGRAFSSMPGLAGSIARDVKDGTIKKYLTQPVDMLGYLFSARLAHKLVYYLVAIGPYVLVFFLCRRFFDGWPDALTITGFVVSLGFAFLLGFLIETMIGLFAFWFLEVSSLIFIFMMLNYFLSGHMIPLDWLASQLPAPLDRGILFLPFQYLAYFPAAVMLNRFTHGQLAQHLVVEAIWVLVLLAANRVLFARGVRRYGAFGG